MEPLFRRQCSPYISRSLAYVKITLAPLNMVYTFALPEEAQTTIGFAYAKVTSDIHHVAHTYANPIVVSVSSQKWPHKGDMSFVGM